ncbi:MAG: helix-turn-helix domain-containing protein [Clostridiales bacterium]|nr:helix-turn-helix domain-containing protein [Clostridiales bacterium]
MLSTQLKILKEKRKLTNQQLSDLSGVPVGTINRILSGQTDNPSFQTVCDMVLAMDGSLDEIVGIKETPDENAEKKVRANQEILSLYESMIASKNQWIHRLFVCCCVLTLVLIFLVVFDLTNPAVGFFRG